MEQSSDNVVLLLGIGLALAGLLLALGLRRWRLALIAGLATATSLLAAFLVLERWGAGVNALVMAGLVLAVGLVVHDVVMDVDQASRARSRAFLSGLRASRRTMGYATAIALVAVAPLLVTGELAAEFTRPVALGFAVAVLVSMVVALTVTPALASLLLTTGHPHAAPAGPGRRLGDRVEGLTRRWSTRVTPAAAVIGVLTLAAVAVVPLLEQARRPALLPGFHESDLVVRWQGDAGVSRSAMTTIAGELGAELRAVPGVREVGGHVGRAVLSDRVNGISTGELWVSLEPDADRGVSVDRVRRVVADHPEAAAEVRSYFSDRVEDVGGLMSAFDRGRVAAGENEVVVRIYGEDLAVLQEQAEDLADDLTDQLGDRLGGGAGVTEVRVESPAVEPNLEVEVDLAAAERVGLKPGDIRRAASTLVSGLRVGSLFEAQKVFDVVVVGDRTALGSPERLGSLLIDTPDTGTVRLDEVADVSFGTSMSVIQRESVSRRLDLVVAVDGDVGAAADAIEEQLVARDFPLEYHAEVIGDTGRDDAADQRLLLVTLGCLVAIYLLLQAGLGSWRLAAGALLLAPVALSGGLVATALAGGTVTIGAALGHLAVLTLFLRTVLVQMRHYQQLQRDEGGPATGDLVARGTRERVLPTMLAAAVGAAAVLPIALVGVRPGLEILHPLALVLLGGLVSTVVVSARRAAAALPASGR